MILLHLSVPIVDGDMAIGWHRINLPWLKRGMGSDHVHGQAGVLLEKSVQAAGSARIEMLGQHDWCREVCWQGTYEHGERLDATRRGANYNQATGARRCSLINSAHWYL